MARYDKYEPKGGGFRAAILADRAKSTGVIGGTAAVCAIGVGLDNAGRVVVGAGTTGIVGVLVLSSDKKAGDIVDVMTDGEIVEIGGVAGTIITANTTTGVLSTTAVSGSQIRVGFIAEAGRMIVRAMA